MRLRSVLAEMPLLPKPKSLRVTASVGLALCGIGQDPDNVIEEADQAMYRAKRGGRNRVEGLACAG